MHTLGSMAMILTTRFYTLHVLHKVIYTLKLKLSIVLVIRIEYNLVVNIIAMLPKAVSYTHLDVYKRQVHTHL